eukprot:9528603-Alexandrium_andersonii.AAC.1
MQLDRGRVMAAQGLRDSPFEMRQVFAAGVEFAEELAEVFPDTAGVPRVHLQEVPHAATAEQTVNP